MRIPTVYSQFRQVLSVYNKRDRKKLFLVALSQVFLAFLDLLGVALLGVIGALSVYGIQSKSPGNRINQILELTNLNQFDFLQCKGLSFLCNLFFVEIHRMILVFHLKLLKVISV